MNRNQLIKFIRRNNRFYAKADLSFYTDEQLRAILEKVTRAKPGKRSSWK